MLQKALLALPQYMARDRELDASSIASQIRVTYYSVGMRQVNTPTHLLPSPPLCASPRCYALRPTALSDASRAQSLVLTDSGPGSLPNGVMVAEFIERTRAKVRKLDLAVEVANPTLPAGEIPMLRVPEHLPLLCIRSQPRTQTVTIPHICGSLSCTAVGVYSSFFQSPGRTMTLKRHLVARDLGGYDIRFGGVNAESGDLAAALDSAALCFARANTHQERCEAVSAGTRLSPPYHRSPPLAGAAHRGLSALFSCPPLQVLP